MKSDVPGRAPVVPIDRGVASSPWAWQRSADETSSPAITAQGATYLNKVFICNKYVRCCVVLCCVVLCCVVLCVVLCVVCCVVLCCVVPAIRTPSRAIVHDQFKASCQSFRETRTRRTAPSDLKRAEALGKIARPHTVAEALGKIAQLPVAIVLSTHAHIL